MLNNYDLPSASEESAVHFQTYMRQENERIDFLGMEF